MEQGGDLALHLDEPAYTAMPQTNGPDGHDIGGNLLGDIVDFVKASAPIAREPAIIYSRTVPAHFWRVLMAS